MSTSTVLHKFLEAFASVHVSEDFMEDDGDRMLDYLAEVRELKDKGNGFFKQYEFDVAAACYDEACKLLSLSLGNIGGQDIQPICDLDVSLISNMAACALKLEEYRAASGMCSMILCTFPRNVKALYRRAVAYMKLKKFSLAELDLMEALVVEPNNKDVLRELDVVKGHLLIKENGKRVLEIATETCVVGKNKKHVHDLESNEGIKDNESGIMKVVENQCDVSTSNEKVNMEDNESEHIQENEVQGICGVDSMTRLRRTEHNKSFLEFSKKGGGSSRLRIPVQSYRKLLREGKTVNFYRKQDLSTLTIRILKDEETKERDVIREQYKKKRKRLRKRRRHPKARRSKVMEDMNEDMTSLEIINTTPAFPSVCSSVFSTEAASSSASSVSDNFSSLGTHIPQDITKGTVNDSSTRVSLLIEQAPSICSTDHIDSKIHQPFFFSARPKNGKDSSVEQLSCGKVIPMLFRSSTHHVRKKWRMATSKKNHSQGNESPRRSLSTFSKSRSLSHNFLRPRGVSVSCCRYSPKAQILKKRKDMASSTYYFSSSLKKPRLLRTPTPSLSLCNNNVVFAPVLEMQVCSV